MGGSDEGGFWGRCSSTATATSCLPPRVANRGSELFTPITAFFTSTAGKAVFGGADRWAAATCPRRVAGGRFAARIDQAPINAATVIPERTTASTHCRPALATGAAPTGDSPQHSTSSAAGAPLLACPTMVARGTGGHADTGTGRHGDTGTWGVPLPACPAVGTGGGLPATGGITGGVFAVAAVAALVGAGEIPLSRAAGSFTGASDDLAAEACHPGGATT